MATTKIWKFKSRLDQLIEYAINGEKTEEKLYVSGINCMPDTAFYEMTNVKKQFFKTGRYRVLSRNSIFCFWRSYKGTSSRNRSKTC